MKRLEPHSAILYYRWHILSNLVFHSRRTCKRGHVKGKMGLDVIKVKINYKFRKIIE